MVWFGNHKKICHIDFPTQSLENREAICVSNQSAVFKSHELGTFKLWISGLMLDPLFSLISRLNNACSPLVINLQIN